MLRLDDRLQVAMRGNMGVQLTPDEVKLVAGWLVTLRKVTERRAAAAEARAALGKYAE